jgi:hypothetical protein
MHATPHNPAQPVKSLTFAVDFRQLRLKVRIITNRAFLALLMHNVL